VFVLDPFHDYAIVEAMPEVMQRIGLKDPDAPRERRIIMPDTIALGGMPADGGAGKGSAITSLLAGRVLWVGEGRVREGIMQKPQCKRGDIVIFLPRTVSYEFLLHGRSIKFVPWHEIPSGAREVAADSREWLEFLALVEGAANDPSPAQEGRSEAV
jgi:hypothetical protein